MMLLRSALRLLPLLVVGVLASRTLAAQALPYSVEMLDSTSTTLQPGGYIEFHMTVRNLTQSTLKLYVSRTTNDLPDHDWSSSICYDDLCFSDTTSYPPVLQFKSGETRSVKVNILAGNVINTTAHVSLVYSTFGGGNMTEKDFTVAVSSQSGVATPAGARSVAAYPNPATSFAVIPLPASAHGSAALTLYDGQGRQVADFTSAVTNAIASGDASVHVELGTLPSGAYRYLLHVAGATTSGAIVIVR